MARFFKEPVNVRNFVLISAVFLFFALGFLKNARGEDNAPPVISEVKIMKLATSSVSITWKTNENADALVNYSLDKSYCTEKASTKGMQHDISLTELDPLTTYYFRLISLDNWGNQTISGDYSFTTKAAEGAKEIPQKITPREKTALEKVTTALEELQSAEAFEFLEKKVEQKIAEEIGAPQIIGKPTVEPGTNHAVISWRTDIDSDTSVAFVEDRNYDPEKDEPYTSIQSSPDDMLTEHSIDIIGLMPATTYHFRVMSKPETGPEAQSEDFTFTTKAILPEIYGVQLDKIEETSVTISWKTSVPTSAVLEYNQIGSKERKSAGDPTLLSSHTIRVEGLVFNASYEAVVVAENELGDKVRSKPVTFKTTKDEIAPIISKVTNESTLYPGDEVRVQTIISWETDELSSCQIFYNQGSGESADIQSFLKESAPVTKHVQVVTSFVPATVYRFWMDCEDRSGNKSKSENFVMFTPQKEKSIIDIIIENFESSFGWVKKIGA